MYTMIWKARCQLLGNAVYHHVYGLPLSPSCPKPGCYNEEWTSHIFNGCLSPLYTKRHDAVQKVVVDHLIQKNLSSYLDIRENRTIVQGELGRPDLSEVILQGPSRINQIGEFTVPFDSNLNQRYDLKKAKYQDLIQARIQSDHQHRTHTNSELAVFVVGALGTIQKDFNSNLALYRINKEDYQYLRNQAVLNSLFGSWNIWTARCTHKSRTTDSS